MTDTFKNYDERMTKREEAIKASQKNVDKAQARLDELMAQSISSKIMGRRVDAQNSLRFWKTNLEVMNNLPYGSFPDEQ
jgi:hypothetical protein